MTDKPTVTDAMIAAGRNAVAPFGRRAWPVTDDMFAAIYTAMHQASDTGDDDAEQPRRAHVLKIEFGANTLDDLIYALNQTAIDLRMGTIVSHGCSGSPSVGFIYDYSVDESWTKDRYFAAIDRLQANEGEG